ncbi:uncharacterized protein cubi_01424 [Cryptosporidium ubiquitum]|uniref:Ribosome biogenesis protein NOP53 n=1 Tax=Cryptosporidium ubiquitum TaxID=857276 RepID=A0A1J4MF44_9CRYT|nr:uncharacterized protein cubi_01424 [Cryptosporidium ubiquitum]OII72091.1 hypothetical protein cubi_01424 [Cryptosporidium ubiquitum]
MVQTKKKFKKIALGDDIDVCERELIGKNIDDTLSSGKLFTFDNEIPLDLCNNLNHQGKNFNHTIQKVNNKEPLNKKNAKSSLQKRSFRKICSVNKDELDIWGDSIPDLDIIKSSMNYPSKLLKSKGPSIQLPHSGQSINPLESDRQDVLFKSFSVLNASTLSKNSNNLSTSLVNSFISNYYEPSEVLNLTETQKYYLVNSLLKGKILKLGSIDNLELIKDTQDEDNISYTQRRNNGIRKKRSEINKEIRRKKELVLKEEKTIIKKLNKDIQNIDIIIQDIDRFDCHLESRKIYLSILREQIDSAKRLGILSKIKIGRNTYKEIPIRTLSKVDIQSSNGSLRKLHIENKSLSKDIVSNIYRRGLTEIPPVNDAQYGRRLQKLLRRNRRSKKITKKVRFF